MNLQTLIKYSGGAHLCGSEPKVGVVYGDLARALLIMHVNGAFQGDAGTAWNEVDFRRQRKVFDTLACDHTFYLNRPRDRAIESIRLSSGCSCKFLDREVNRCAVR